MKLAAASIRGRLTLWYGAAVAFALGLYAAAALLVARQRLYAALDSQLHEDREVAEHLLQRDAQGRLRLGDGDHGDDEALGFALVVQAEDGRVLCTAPPGDEPPFAPALPSWRGERSLDRGGESVRVYSGTESVAGGLVVIHVARSERPLHDDLGGLLAVLAWLLPLAVAVSAAGVWLVSRRALAPLAQMAERARRVSAERLGERLPVANPHDELGRLALVFNDTLARLERSFTQLRQFTADASHELRTPLTVLRSVGEVAVHREQSAAGYREVIGSMLEEVDRMARLVDTMLLLARSDSGAMVLERQTLDLGELAREVVTALDVLADEKGQCITVSAPAPVRVRGDHTLLRQALSNLVDNAIKHSPAGGAIAIDVVVRQGLGECAVRDSGPGIPPEHQPRIFERFYRVDGARARSNGGTGLGLALARSIVEVHGGVLELVASDAAGSVFAMRLPLESPPS